MWHGVNKRQLLFTTCEVWAYFLQSLILLLFVSRVRWVKRTYSLIGFRTTEGSWRYLSISEGGFCCYNIACGVLARWIGQKFVIIVPDSNEGHFSRKASTVTTVTLRPKNWSKISTDDFQTFEEGKSWRRFFFSFSDDNKIYFIFFDSL